MVVSITASLPSTFFSYPSVKVFRNFVQTSGTNLDSSACYRTLGTHSALTSDPVKKAALRCYTTPQLNTKQRDLCRKHPTLMASVAKGAKEAIEECKIQFEFRRWNCSLVPESGTLFDPILKRGKGDYTMRLMLDLNDSFKLTGLRSIYFHR